MKQNFSCKIVSPFNQSIISHKFTKADKIAAPEFEQTEIIEHFCNAGKFNLQILTGKQNWTYE